MVDEINPTRVTFNRAAVVMRRTKRTLPLGVAIRLGRRWPRRTRATVLDDQLLGADWRWDGAEEAEDEPPTRLWNAPRLSLA